jgi:CAAX protease family protein
MKDEGITKDTSFPRWGLVGTLSWGTFIFISFIIIQVLVMGIYIGISYGEVSSSEVENLMNELQSNGTVLSLCTIATTIICCSLIFLAIIFKKGSKIKDYLGLRSVEMKVFIFWLLVMIVFIAIIDTLSVIFGRDIVPEYMLSAYTSTEKIWMLWFALIIAAPIFEELFFRGFLFSGISSSFIGPIGAVIIISIMWAAIHVQYDLYDISTIFVSGLILGFARIKTGSVLLTIGLHSFINLIATIETMFFVSVNSAI